MDVWIHKVTTDFVYIVWNRLLYGGYALTEPMGLDKPLRRPSEYPKPKPRKHGRIGKEIKFLGNPDRL